MEGEPVAHLILYHVIGPVADLSMVSDIGPRARGKGGRITEISLAAEMEMAWWQIGDPLLSSIWLRWLNIVKQGNFYYSH